MTDYQAVLEQALQLTPDEQAILICTPERSIERECDKPLSPEWIAEIDRRTKELEADPMLGIPWEQVRANPRSRLGRNTEPG